jgi:hypothetical protein
MVVPASITSMILSGLPINASINCVSRARERLLTTDWLPESALSIKTLLLTLFEDGNRVTIPFREEVRDIVMEELKA